MSDSPEDPRVRPARPSDLPAIRETLVASWRTGYDGLVDADALAAATADPAEFYPAERFEGKLADDRLRYFVAVPADGDGDSRDRPDEDDAGDGPRVRGIATVNWSPDNTHGFVPEGDAQVRSVYVHPDHWERGLGTALVEAGLAALPAAVDRVWVECLADNDRGIGFYRGLGFDPVEERSIELFGDAYPTRVFRRGLG